MNRCKDCTYFEFAQAIAIPTLKFDGEMQHVEVIEPEHDGKCTHEINWRPSRGDMPCDLDYKCSNFELRED